MLRGQSLREAGKTKIVKPWKIKNPAVGNCLGIPKEFTKPGKGRLRLILKRLSYIGKGLVA